MTNAQNILERFVWTFIQAAIGSLPVTFALTSENLSAIGWSALAAGLSAAISLAKNLTATGIVTQSGKHPPATTAPVGARRS